MAMALRPEIRLVAGRMFTPGRRECIVSRSVARRFPASALGRSFRSGKNTWTVVGLFDGRHTAYDSEIWVDAEEARDAFHRSYYGSILLRPASAAVVPSLMGRIETDRTLRLRARSEADYFREQTRTAAPIQVFGLVLAWILGLGAGFAAMNTVYANVSARSREIGTLRVLGFRRRSIYAAFLVESIVIALAGGILGDLLALPMNGLLTGTFNWSTFAEVSFEFRVTAGLLGLGLLFALVMGTVGGVFPARWAARRDLLESLRGG